MSKFNMMLIGSCAVAVFALSACATPNTAPTAEVAAAAPTVAKTESAMEPGSAAMKTETGQVAESTDGADPNRRICKRQSFPGSNMKKRVCGTALEWEEKEKVAREAAGQLQGGYRSQGGSN